MQRLLKIAAVLFLALPVFVSAQNTVTATVADPNGNPYANGTVSAQSVAASGQPTFYTSPASTDANGAFSMSLQTAAWVFTVCAPPVQLGPTTNPTPKQVCFQSAPISVFGGSLDITAQLDGSALVLGPKFSGGGGGGTSGCGSVPCIVGNPSKTQTITPTSPTAQALVVSPAVGADPILDTFQVLDQNGAQEVGVEAGGSAQFGPNTEGPHIANFGGGVSPGWVMDCDSYGAYYGGNNQVQMECIDGLWTVTFGRSTGEPYTAPWMTLPCAYNPPGNAILVYNGVTWCGVLPIPNTSVGAVPTSVGTNHTMTAPREFYYCSGACTITAPPPQPGYEFCASNDDNVTSVITWGAIGSGAMYENTARTSYGTAGTGTIHSGGAATDSICYLAKDSTHYNVKSFTGTWSASAASPTFSLVQLYATNATVNHGADTCAGFLTPGSPSCSFVPGSNQVAGNTVVVGFGAQAASISAKQTISVVTDSNGTTYTHPASCATFFPGTAKVQDCWYSTNATGGGSPPTISITIATPVAAGERIGAFYAEFHPSTGTGTLDGIGQINDNATCGSAGSPCSGVPAASLSPAMAGTADACVQWIVAGGSETSVNPPWAPETSNGDHTAQAAAVGLNNSFTTPLWQSNFPTPGIGTALCFK